MIDPRLETLVKQRQGYWAKRLAAELDYAYELSRIDNDRYDDLIRKALDTVESFGEGDGGLTRSMVEAAEAALGSMASTAKKYTILCAAHAHIDMNWMWRWDETVAITLDTFRTMLGLMEEYPDFTFSQSQASVYRLVERYDPEMLAAIRQRVKEGRWEVTASTWVEADKNMSSGESMARHLLYTRRYLRQLFNLGDDAFYMDYEPDTFGHSRNVPEILSDGGVRYYYHCRGDQDELLYRWQAPSGRSILVYREPTWYLGDIDPGMAVYVPGFCHQYGLDSMLKVYGVGDHGGGPTRRDVERLIDMDTWPIYPRIRFSTYTQFFAKVDKIAAELPVKGEELNFIFTGCYSSQSRIKRANRLGETALYDAETLSSLNAVQTGAPSSAVVFGEAWKDVLFNQFHDILPGSGTIDTREYALGLFQNVLATAGSQKMQAMRILAGLGQPPERPNREAVSEGAGVGFGLPDFRISQVSRGQGIRRLFHIFNTAAWEREGLAEIVLWDWEGDLGRMVWNDTSGNQLRHQLIDPTWQNYWGHRYVRILVPVQVPACGFTTIVLDESHAHNPAINFPLDWRTERPDEMVLENEYLLARFDPVSCALVTLADKQSGEMLVNPDRPAGLRFILEDDRRGMTAWTVGRYRQIINLHEDVRLRFIERGELRQRLAYEFSRGNSQFKVVVSLDAGSRQLDYQVDCDWLEVGRKDKGVPQLNFHLPLAYASRAYRYDVPLGATERPDLDMDVPGLSWANAIPVGETQSTSAMLVSLGSYGFRGTQDSLNLTLLRSSYDPDPFPELGQHTLRFAVRMVGAQDPSSALARAAFGTLHPLEVLSGSGEQPEQHSYLSLEGDSLLVSSIKLPEDDPSGKKLMVRLIEMDGLESRATLQFPRSVKQASRVDVHERTLVGSPSVQVEGQTVTVKVEPYRVCSLQVEFE